MIERERKHLCWIIVCNPGSKPKGEGSKETFGIITQFFSNVCKVDTKALEIQ